MDKEQIINKAIGDRLFIFRKTKKLTRTKLANVLGITQQQLDKYEKGQNRISAAKLAIIAETFKIDISYFYSNIIMPKSTDTIKPIQKNIDSLISYFLNIKKQENKNLIISLIKELSK